MYLDTVNTNDIKKYLSTGVIQGVTTNPTLFWKENVNPDKQIKEIISCNPELLFVQLVGDNFEELKSDYQKLKDKELSQKICLKINLNNAGLEFIKYIKDNDRNELVLGTAVYSAEQGILGALAGCNYIAPYINRMSNENIDPYIVIKHIRKYIDNHNTQTKIMGASFKNTKQVIDALDSGAHTATIPPDIFERMVNNQLATEAIKHFNFHGKEALNF